jgi:anti-sigma regulatory factor (Ser/Thr protein kinase)
MVWAGVLKEWMMPDQKQDEHILEQEFTVEGGDFIHAGEVSSRIKSFLKEIGVPQEIIRRAAIATYEAEMNVVCYANRGKFYLAIAPDHLKIVVEDEGQGIADIDLAMQEGYSTSDSAIKEMGFGAGMGLPNIKKNTDDLHIASVVGKGTRVEMVILTQQ